YLFLGRNLSFSTRYKISKESVELGLRMIEGQRKQLASGDLPFNDPATAKLQDLIRMNLSSSYAMYSQDNEVDIYTDGREMLDRILQSIGEAKHYVHIMFYILRDDRTGRSLIQALTRKARESVEIRLL